MTATASRTITEKANLKKARKALKATQKLVKKSILPNIKRAAKRGYNSYITGIISGRTNSEQIIQILESRGFVVVEEGIGISKICW